MLVTKVLCVHDGSPNATEAHGEPNVCGSVLRSTYRSLHTVGPQQTLNIHGMMEGQNGARGSHPAGEDTWDHLMSISPGQTLAF